MTEKYDKMVEDWVAEGNQITYIPYDMRKEIQGWYDFQGIKHRGKFSPKRFQELGEGNYRRLPLPDLGE